MCLCACSDLSLSLSLSERLDNFLQAAWGSGAAKGAKGEGSESRQAQEVREGWQIRQGELWIADHQQHESNKRPGVKSW